MQIGPCRATTGLIVALLALLPLWATDAGVEDQGDGPAPDTPTKPPIPQASLAFRLTIVAAALLEGSLAAFVFWGKRWTLWQRSLASMPVLLRASFLGIWTIGDSYGFRGRRVMAQVSPCDVRYVKAFASARTRPAAIEPRGSAAGRVIWMAAVAKRVLLVCVLALGAAHLTCADEGPCSCPPVDTADRCRYVTDFDEPPTLIRIQTPVYPEEARRNNVEGTVHVVAGVGTDSLPCGVRIATSDSPLLDQASLDAVLHSLWVPARRDGQTVAAEVDVPIRFSLNKNPPRDVLLVPEVQRAIR